MVYPSDKRNSLRAIVYTWPWTSKFSCSFFYNTAEVLDFGLQMSTGPISGVVACILLVSSPRNEFG